MADGAVAPAAAPPPALALRQIFIPNNKKHKGAPPLTLEDVRNAAGVGDAPAQLEADAPGAKFAHDRARGIVYDLRSRDRWAADDDAFNAVRFFQQPLADVCCVFFCPLVA